MAKRDCLFGRQLLEFTASSFINANQYIAVIDQDHEKSDSDTAQRIVRYLENTGAS